MPSNNAWIAAATLGFGLSVATEPALAANNRPLKVLPGSIIAVKGGAQHMHNKAGEEATSPPADHAREAPQASGQFASLPPAARSPEGHR